MSFRGNAAVVRLGRDLAALPSAALGFFGWAIFFGAWYGVTRFSIVPEILLPPPHKVISAAVALFTQDAFAYDLWASVKRIFTSFALTCMIGVPLGIAVGIFAPARAFFGPFVAAWRYLPAAAFVPILLMWLGTGEPPKLALLMMGVVFFQITIVADMTRAIPQPLLETAMTLGAGRWQVVARVVLPWMWPNVVVAMRQTIAIGWTYLVIAEIIASTDGIGAVMMRAQRFVHTDKIIVCIVAIGILGLLTDWAFQQLYRWLFQNLSVRT